MKETASSEYYMSQALKEARRALDAGEVPVGAVIVFDSKIIARAHNQVVTLRDPTAHAEMIAITQAADYLGNERLINADLYVTIEPCSMCAGAAVLARIKRIFYGAKDPKGGGCGSVFNIPADNRLNHKIEIISGIMLEECAYILREFFKNKRMPCLGNE